MPLVVRLFEPLSVANDRPLTTEWTSPGEQFQRNPGHPGSVLLFRFRQFDKENHGWRDGSG
jgi:hypothetical protein